MSPTLGLPTKRFLQTLEIVAKEGKHLSYSWGRLFGRPRVREDAVTRMGHTKESLPAALALPAPTPHSPLPTNQ